MTRHGPQMKHEAGPLLFRILAALVAFLVWPFVRIDTVRMDVAMRVSSAVVIANHRSFLDALVGLVAIHRLKRYPRVIVADNWFRHRLTGPMLRAGGAIPMTRGRSAGDFAAAKRVLDSGLPIVILPEGRLAGKPGEPASTGPFKTGAARLAMHGNVGIWPMALVGTDVVWPRNKRLPRLGTRRTNRVLVLGGEHLLSVNGDPRAASQGLRQAMADLLAEAAGRYDSPSRPPSSSPAPRR